MIAVGLVGAFVVNVARERGRLDSTPDRIVSFVAFFTVVSNICVAVTTGALAIRPQRSSEVFHVFRLLGVVAITVTGVVHWLALSELGHLSGWDLAVDTILHSVSPILAVVGWLAWGPRAHLTPRIAMLSVVPAVLWLMSVLALGMIMRDRHGRQYYAYPFMDVQAHGYAVALGRCGLVAALFVALAFGALLVDGQLPGDRASAMSRARRPARA